MLVLTRKLRESLVIGETSNLTPEITITVLEVRVKAVKLGFTADPCIKIRRSEVWARIQAGATPKNQTSELIETESLVLPGG